MAIGPLEQFAFPGTYTRTFVQAPSPTAAGQARYAALIAVGQEEERIEAFEMVRGSSSSAANIILGEIASSNGRGNVQDSVNVDFYTRQYPLVLNDGEGTYATNPNDVVVVVNGEGVPVQSIDAATGLITLVNPPAQGDIVELNYYFKRRDTYVENEDLSLQADGSNRVFKVDSARIVAGDNGGNNATSTSIGAVVTNEVNGVMIQVPVIQAQVDGTLVDIDSISGGYGTFTLVDAPADGAEVLVSYFTNNFQDTADILPAAIVSNIARVGFDPGRTDFFKNKDYVLARGNEIHWGSSIAVSAGINEIGADAFNDNKVDASMVDYRYYMVEAQATTTAVTKIYTLPYQPVKGDGKGTPLTSVSNGTANPHDDLVVYVGADEASASQVVVTKVEGRNITLQSAPASGDKVFASFFVNTLADDTWTVRNKVSGGEGVGEYTVTGDAYGSARQVILDPSSTSTATFLDTGTVTWDGVGGTSNAYVAPSRVYGDEVVTVTVDASGEFIVTSSVPNATGSGAVNTGMVGKTYKDSVTGFTFALEAATAGTLVFNVSKRYTVSTNVELGIPGVRFRVEDTINVGLEDTAIIQTFNMVQDEEPRVGDVYYVTFDKEKTDYSVKYVTSFPEVQNMFGPLAQNNPLVMAANLYFLNGGQALAIKQVRKAPNSNDASVASYVEAIDSFNEPLSNGTRPALLSVLTANRQVLNYLRTSNAQQSSIRMQNERTSFIGLAAGSTPEDALNYAKALKSELITLVYPDSAVITIPDSNGVDQDILVGGEYVAVAMTGADVSPVYDVATPLTNISLVGFQRLGRSLTKATAALVAQNGVTVLENKNNNIKVLMGLTTDMTSVLTRNPRIVETKHEVQKGVRRVGDRFIGRKGLGGVSNEIKTALASYFTSLKSLNLIADFSNNIVVRPDDKDPSVINVAVRYVPIFGVDWIVATHYLRSTL